MHKIRRLQFGFTLVELMVTIAVAAIIMGIAAPSFNDMIKDNRLTTTINELAMALNLARSEAIKRSASVTLCQSNADQTNCSGSWNNGWIVFVDDDDDVTIGNGEEILLVHAALPTGVSLAKTQPATIRIRYSSEGFASGFNSTFSLCDDRGVGSARGLVVFNGRARVAAVADMNCP